MSSLKDKKEISLWTVALQLFALVFFASAGTPATVTPQNVYPNVPITSGPEIRSWSLFLVCNPQWLAAEKAGDLNDLYLSFRNFGEAIGDDNLAVWFSKPGGKNDDAVVGKNLDVPRCSKFCRAFGLTPSRGPHLVVMTTYPDESLLRLRPPAPRLPAGSAVFELGNMRPTAIHELLAGLTDDLVREGRVTRRTQPAAPEPPTGRFVRLLETVQRALNNFGCAWSFKVNAGAAQAELHACHKG